MMYELKVNSRALALSLPESWVRAKSENSPSEGLLGKGWKLGEEARARHMMLHSFTTVQIDR